MNAGDLLALTPTCSKTSCHNREQSSLNYRTHTERATSLLCKNTATLLYIHRGNTYCCIEMENEALTTLSFLLNCNDYCYQVGPQDSVCDHMLLKPSGCLVPITPWIIVLIISSCFPEWSPPQVFPAWFPNRMKTLSTVGWESFTAAKPQCTQ